MRLILYTGKGGVGKSSIAAATAVRTAELGRRTLLVSLDLAHNLSDVFDASIGGNPVDVADGLTVLEVNALKEIRENWKPAQDYFAALLGALGIEGAVAEEVALFPGVDELFVLSRVLAELETGRYDVVILDCSPTAGTLRLLTLSDTVHTKLKKLGEMKRKFIKLVRPVAKRVRGVRHIVPSEKTFDVFDDLMDNVARLGAILKDPAISSIRLVLNPDRVAIAETCRTFTYFGLFSFAVDGIFVNKVLPAELAGGYLNRWYALQAELIESIDRSFLDTTKIHVPLLGKEPIGLESLAQMARGMFDGQPPDRVLSPARPFSLDRVDGAYRLTFSLPGTAKESLDVGRKGDALILGTGNHTRVFSLPDTLAQRDIATAEFDDGKLTVTFASVEDVPAEIK